MAVQTRTIALAGNPNVGKSTIFNALTGSKQHVGNWPGKTVEKKEGRLRLGDRDLVVVDLPGAYSLTAYSIEEIISRDFIVREQPGVVVAVVDAANLERNLYFVCQLLELALPLVIALNMSDIARERGMTISPQVLSHNLGGVPVIEMVGNNGVGVEQLKSAIHQVLDNHTGHAAVDIAYDPTVETEITALESTIREFPELTAQYPPRWLAVKLLENDDAIASHLRASGCEGIVTAAEAAMGRVEDATEDDAETLITDGRYGFIGEIIQGALTRPRVLVETKSDKMDRLLTHRIWGVPIFLLLMWTVFQFTTNISAPMLDWMDGVISGPFTHWVSSLLGVVGLGGSWVEALLVDGVIAGVGGVLVFIPVLMSLYFAIGVLEDSGYMARAAFVMDRVMRSIGLHGKSFLPMLVGFGCTVPAVYATRTLENEDDRKLTGFLVTFMSCGARLPVYVVIGAAFFGAQAGNLIFAMYILGIGVALLTGFALKRTVYRNKPPQPFVMELPPYRIPNLRDVMRQMWERTSSFIRQAGTVILTMSVIIWLLLAVPVNGSGSFNDVEPGDSLYGTISQTIAPIFQPAGFGEWQTAGTLITGLVAKEVVIGTMSQIFVGTNGADEGAATPTTLVDDVREIGTSFVDAVILTGQEIVNVVPRTVNIIPGVSMPEADFLGTAGNAEDTTTLESALASTFTPLAAVAFTVFILLYTPCISTLAAMRQEFGGRWTLYQIGYTLLIAWAAAVVVYQGGILLGFGA